MKENIFNPIILVFKDHDFESRFRKHFAKSELIFVKYFVGLLLVFNAMYVVRDLYFPTQREIISTQFQMFVVLPFYSLFLIIFYTRERFFKGLTLSTLLLASFTIVSQFTMLYLNGSDGSGLRSIILVVLVGTYTFSGILFREALFFITPLLVILLILFIFYLFDFNLGDRTALVMQYVMSVPGLLFIRYRIEYQQRYSFYRHQLLESEQEKLTVRSKEIQALSDLRKDLMSVLAHDVRSPLANLRSALSLTGSSDLTVEEASGVFSKIEKQVGSVDFLINDILVWIKSQSQEIKSKLEPYDLTAAMSELWHIYGDQFNEKGIEWKLDIQHPNVICNADMLKAILRNLITNAIKFSPRNAEISLKAESNGHKVKISISDQGAGMSVQDLIELKKSFKSTEGTSNETGTGLGLKICDALVRAQNSQLQLDSIPEKGTIISFELQKA